MWFGPRNPRKPAEYGRGALSQFGPEMLPLVRHLSTRFFDLSAKSSPCDFGTVKLVAPPFGLLDDAIEECGDRMDRPPVSAETGELWMMPIPTGATLQNFLSQQRLAPGGDQSFGIQVTRMQGP